jgi:hypothetical protein
VGVGNSNVNVISEFVDFDCLDDDPNSVAANDRQLGISATEVLLTGGFVSLVFP